MVRGVGEEGVVIIIGSGERSKVLEEILITRPKAVQVSDIDCFETTTSADVLKAIEAGSSRTICERVLSDNLVRTTKLADQL